MPQDINEDVTNDEHALMKSFLLFVTFGLLFSGQARAQAQQISQGVVFLPSISILKESGTLLNDQTVTEVDARLGYLTASGWYFGMIYFNTSSGGTSNLNGNGIGNSVGYFYGPVSLIASYFLTSNLTESTPTSYLQRFDGMGVQIDLSLLLPIGSDFYVGPVLTFKDITYQREQDYTGAITNNLQTQSFFYPYVGVAYKF